MKKVLIVSYYFPPNTGAPAWRPFSWANNFHKEGIQTTIITRHWTGKENTWEDFIRPNNSPLKEVSNEHYRLFYLPSKQNRLCAFFSSNHFFAKIFGKAFFFLLALFGKINNEIDGNLAFKDFIKEHLKNNKYDVVVITVPPFNMLQMVDMFAANNIKVVVDVRDLWNNMMLTNGYSPGFKQKVWDKIYSFYFQKWLRKANYVTAITPVFNEVLKQHFSGGLDIIYNGFEEAIFLNSPSNKSEKFVFSVVGSIYPQQDISIIIEGLKLFLKDKSVNKVQLRFIGLSVIPSVYNQVKSSLNNEFVYFSDRVSKEEAIAETKMANVLSYAGWLGTKGIISTKIFDYIASGNPVLLAPGDKDIIDDLLKQTNTGVSVFNANDFSCQLNQWYAKWEKGLPLNENYSYDQVRFYSREHQAKLMAAIIKSL